MTKLMEKPIPSFLVMFICFMIFYIILANILTYSIDAVVPGTGSIFSNIICGIIIAAIYVYMSKIKGFFSFSNCKLVVLLSVPGILLFLGNITDVNFALPVTLSSAVLIILGGIAPGVYEEIFFRGVIISYLMKFFRKSKNIYPVLIVSALIFGLSHSFGFAAGASLSMTIFQVCYAFAIGILFGAIYLRTGNFWIIMIIHSIIDILAGCCSDGPILTAAFVLDFSAILVIIASIISIVLGLYYVRSAKHDEIIAIWDEKWA